MTSRTSKLATAFVLSGAALLTGCAGVQTKPIDRVANGHKMSDCIFQNLDKHITKLAQDASNGNVAPLREFAGDPAAVVENFIGYERSCVAEVANIPLNSVPPMDLTGDDLEVVKAQAKTLNTFLDRYVDQNVMGEDMAKNAGAFYERLMNKALSMQPK